MRRGLLSVSVMHEMAQARETHVLSRGQYDQPGDRVEFGVPAALGPLPPGAPANRLGLAQWLVPDVVPVGYAEEPQESWAVLTAFLLRAIELVAAWVAAIVLAVMCGAWARNRMRQPLG